METTNNNIEVNKETKVTEVNKETKVTKEESNMENNIKINKEALNLGLTEIMSGLNALDLDLAEISNILTHEEFEAIRAGIDACFDIVERRCYGKQTTDEERTKIRANRAKNKITELKERRRAQ